MELELNRTHLTGYECILDTTVFREETLETIVSDANPDILRLIDTQGMAFLKGKAASDGRAVLTGTARLAVLYLPDGGTGPCRMEVNIPFSVTVEDPKIKGGCTMTALPRISSADARTMNPRKVVTRVEVAIAVKVFAACSNAVCTGITAADGTVELLQRTCQSVFITAVREKQFTFEDNLSIPAGRPAAEELISSRVAYVCHDTKIIGNKMVFKGEAAVQLLYRTGTGELDTADFTLPFSQIAEVSGVGEDGRCTAEICPTGAEFVLGGDGRAVSASLSTLSQFVVQEERNVELLSDVYSTCCKVNAKYAPYHYEICTGEGTGTQSVRETIETGMQMKSVVDTACSVGRTFQRREGGELRFGAQVTVTVQCRTEDGEYCAVSRSMEAGCAVNVPEECVCRFSCRIENLGAAVVADGIEVRFQLEFPYVSVQTSHETVVCDVSVEQTADENIRRPSVILKIVEDGESLWDVAKRYGTAISEIVKANDLENEQPCGGTLLLIPRKR